MKTTRKNTPRPASGQKPTYVGEEFVAVLDLLEAIQDGFSIDGQLGKNLSPAMRKNIECCLSDAWSEILNLRPRMDAQAALDALAGKL